MTITVQIHGLGELLEFLNRVKDPGEWVARDDDVEFDAGLRLS